MPALGVVVEELRDHLDHLAQSYALRRAPSKSSDLARRISGDGWEEVSSSMVARSSAAAELFGSRARPSARRSGYGGGERDEGARLGHFGQMRSIQDQLKFSLLLGLTEVLLGLRAEFPSESARASGRASLPAAPRLPGTPVPSNAARWFTPPAWPDSGAALEAARPPNRPMQNAEMASANRLALEHQRSSASFRVPELDNSQRIWPLAL
jgi:hypothetical protein